MASSKRPPSDPPGGRRKRPPTVINLEATEVPPESAASPSASEQPADTPPQATEMSVPPSSAKPEETPFEKAAFEPPPPPPREPEPPRAAAEEQPERRPPPAGFPGSSGPQIMAGAFGAAGGFVLFLLLWLFGAFSSSAPVIPVQPDLSPRLAAIESQLNAIAARPAPAGVDPKGLDKTLDDIAARLAKLESAVAAPRVPVTDPVVLSRITATENAAKSLADNMAAVARREDSLEAALRETNTKIDDRVGKLTATTSELQTRARETAAGSDRASRLAVAAAALRNAVERGDPYAAELDIVKPLASDAAAVAALEPFAASGVPGAAALGQELAAIVRPMLRAAGEVPRDGDYLDKLVANAEKLIRIKPVGEASGDDRVAILARIEQRASQGNVAGALAELGKLPAAARAPKQAELAAWIARAEARNKAIEAGRRLATEAVAALKVMP
jgi:hypothetical protein